MFQECLVMYSRKPVVSTPVNGVRKSFTACIYPPRSRDIEESTDSEHQHGDLLSLLDVIPEIPLVISSQIPAPPKLEPLQQEVIADAYLIDIPPTVTNPKILPTPYILMPQSIATQSTRVSQQDNISGNDTLVFAQCPATPSPTPYDLVADPSEYEWAKELQILTK